MTRHFLTIWHAQFPIGNECLLGGRGRWTVGQRRDRARSHQVTKGRYRPRSNTNACDFGGGTLEDMEISALENFSSERKSERFWDHVDCSDRLHVVLSHGPPHCYYTSHYLCSTRTTNIRRIGRNVGEIICANYPATGGPAQVSHPKALPCAVWGSIRRCSGALRAGAFGIRR